MLLTMAGVVAVIFAAAAFWGLVLWGVYTFAQPRCGHFVRLPNGRCCQCWKVVK